MIDVDTFLPILNIMDDDFGQSTYTQEKHTPGPMAC